jgi:hypothetical protein
MLIIRLTDVFPKLAQEVFQILGPLQIAKKEAEECIPA